MLKILQNNHWIIFNKSIATVRQSNDGGCSSSSFSDIQFLQFISIKHSETEALQGNIIYGLFTLYM